MVYAHDINDCNTIIAKTKIALTNSELISCDHLKTISPSFVRLSFKVMTQPVDCNIGDA